MKGPIGCTLSSSQSVHRQIPKSAIPAVKETECWKVLLAIFVLDAYEMIAWQFGAPTANVIEASLRGTFRRCNLSVPGTRAPYCDG